MLIVNLETFRTKNVDEAQVKELGLPSGFVVADAVTQEQWLAAGQRLADIYAEETWKRRSE